MYSLIMSSIPFFFLMITTSSAQLKTDDDSTIINPATTKNGNKSKINSTVPIHRPLRIAQFGTPWLPIPPKKYGGTERVAYFLIQELVRRGHNVTLFGTADSNTTNATLLVAHPKLLSTFQQRPMHNSWEVYFMWMLEQVRIHAHEFDILHFHTFEHIGAIQPFVHRTLTTVHSMIPNHIVELFSDVPLVSISDDQRLPMPKNLRFVDTIYHGIPRDQLRYNPNPAGTRPYLAFLGSLLANKAPHRAVEIALGARMPLKIAGLISEKDCENYWPKKLKPMIDEHPDLVEYVGELNDTQKSDFLGNAFALIFPSEWAEPFGLVMIEAMACGTPVIGHNHGSVPEVIDPGVTGLLYNTVPEGVEAVKRIGQMSRAGVRKRFERRFTVEAMVDGYERIYRKLMAEDEERTRKECGAKKEKDGEQKEDDEIRR